MSPKYSWKDPRARWALWAGLAITIVFAIIIFREHSRPEVVTVDSVPVIVFDTAASPCKDQRVELACARASLKGWPQCFVEPGVGIPIVLAVDLPQRPGEPVWVKAAVGTERLTEQLKLGVAPDPCTDEHGEDMLCACRVLDFSIEHELVCHIYGAQHSARTGSVCATLEGMGMDIPWREDGLDR